MPSTTAAKMIAVLQHSLAAYGLPEQLISDNGPQYISEEFKTFMQSNAVRHIRSEPITLHPPQKGLSKPSNKQ